MAERFNQRGVIRQSNLSTGVSSGLMALTQRFNQFSQQASQERRQRVQEESFKAGQSSLEEGERPEFKEERFFGGVSAKAFNKGLMSTYLADVSNSNREELAAIERENGDDSIAYQEAVAAQRAALEKEVDPAALPDVLGQFDKYASNGTIRVQDREFTKRRRAGIESAVANAESLSNEAAAMNRNGDQEGAALRLQELQGHLAGAVDAELLTTEQAATAFREAERESAEQGKRKFYDDLVESDGFDAAFDKLEEDSKRIPKGWKPDEWDSYIADQQSDLNRKLSRTQREAKASATEIKKNRDFADIERRIDGDERVVLNARAVDAYYNERIAPITDNLDPAQKNAVLTQFVDKTKIVPLSMRNQASSFIQSGNPELMKEAIMLADSLDEVPGAGEIFSPNQRVFGMLAVDLSANLEAAEAVRLARQATDPKDNGRIDIVNNNLKKVKDKSESYQDAAVGIFGGFWSIGAPDVDDITRAQMGAEYGSLYESYLKAGADESQAADLAKGAIQRNWREWEGRIMKYAPDTYYSVDGDSSYVMDQLFLDVNKENIFPENIPRDRIILISNDYTARGASAGLPTYGVTVIDQSGRLVTMDRMWAPDQAGEIEKRKTETVAKAKQRRIEAMQKGLLSDDTKGSLTRGSF
jgi:hypothetical protein